MMKKILFALVTFISFNAHAQNMALEMTDPVINSTTTPKTITFTVKLKATGTSFQLGASNIRFGFDNTALSTTAVPVFTMALPSPYSSPVSGLLTSGTTKYVNLGWAIPTGDPAAAVITSTPTIIGTVKMNITDATKTAGLAFRLFTVTAGYTNPTPAPTVVGTATKLNDITGAARTAEATAIVNLVAAPLPIELSSFTAVQNGTANEIRWTTEIEKNVKNFVVEKSKDAKTWTVLGTTNPNAIKRYDMKDETPFLTTYYRLRTNENDGRESTSNVVVVNRGDKANILELSPNPTSRDIKVKFESAEASEVTLQVLDMVGRVHSNSALDVTKGTNLIDVTTSALPAGVYYLNLNTGATTLTQRFVKQ